MPHGSSEALGLKRALTVMAGCAALRVEAFASLTLVGDLSIICSNHPISLYQVISNIPHLYSAN